MDAIAAAMITKSLDGLSLRLAVSAANIANANSKSYRPMQVSFEDRLRAAASQGLDAIRGIEARISPEPTGRFGDEPRTDLELDTASNAAMRYAALVDILGREMDLTRAALRGGQQ